MTPICLHKQTYFDLIKKRNFFFNSFLNTLTKSRFSGKEVLLYLATSRFTFEQAAFLKGGGFLVLGGFLEVEPYSAICVAQRNRGFGSSLKLRFVDSGYLLEKHLLLFSTKILFVTINIDKASMLFSVNKKRLKSKLYFLQATNQRRLLSRLY